MVSETDLGNLGDARELAEPGQRDPVMVGFGPGPEGEHTDLGTIQTHT